MSFVEEKFTAATGKAKGFVVQVHDDLVGRYYEWKFGTIIDSGLSLECPECGFYDEGHFGGDPAVIPCWDCYRKERLWKR